jgi:signal transduction histidine kinase
VARRRFLRRVAVFGVAALVVLALLAGLLVWALATTLGSGLAAPIAAIIVVFLLAVVVLRMFAGLRRSVGGMAELIEAAGRVEAGEVGTQVRERGPGEVRALARAFNAMSTRLAETDEQRRRLLSDVSHELRTPLTVIQGNIEGILDGVYPADEAHLAPILDEARLLQRLVDDLRTLASAEAGRLSLHREATDLARLSADIVDGFRAQADAGGIRLSVTVQTLPPANVDPERVRQILTNLVANALRYTPAGREINLALAATDGGVRIEVTDTGRGMAPAELDRIFERFYRSPDSRGSGLGLPIVRELVRAHGGEVRATSREGGGTTISVTLPADSA